MKKIVAFVLSFVVLQAVSAQVKNPVQWAFTAKKINATTYEVHLTANIETGWHLYSQTTPDGGPVPTSIEFAKNPLVLFDGAAKEIGKLEQHNEPLFGVDVKQYSNRVDFVQTVKIKGKAKTALNGNIEFMTCNDHECLPPRTQKFSIALK
ncbi:MAG: protein-disulfide reductase DsbD domain-containing protein [Flavisolibacter sp.]